MTDNSKERTIIELYKQKIIPIVRTNNFDLADQAIQSLKKAGFKTVEITLTIPGAIDLIRKYSHDEDLTVGAGTILSLKDVKYCIDAGAKYIVAPCIVDGMAELCHDANVVSIMSGLTPFEVHHAWKNGSDIVKVFPANSMDGPTYIKSLKSVFPNIPMLPTGGIKKENLVAYFNAGADMVGVGNSLVDVNLLKNESEFVYQSKEFIEELNKLVVEGS